MVPSLDREDFKELKEDMAISRKLDALIDSIESLTKQVAALSDMHLKIIYWLLVLVSLSLAGVRGMEALQAFASHKEVNVNSQGETNEISKEVTRLPSL